MPAHATPTPAGREHVAAVGRLPGGACEIVPSASGARLFRRAGARGFREAVAGWARSEGLEPGAIRVVSELAPGGAATPVALGPRLRSVEAPAPGLWLVTLAVPFELAIFDGHFATVPIVPGAVLAGWAADFGATHAGWTHGARESRAMKFRRIVQPGPDYRLELRLDGDGAELRFRYESPSGPHAEGAWRAPP
ncbi:MAG: hypothetical protein JSR73_16055 [Proteobacteria bacterium]|nr:hypothetical protein [Pseudomonadota bacterium]